MSEFSIKGIDSNIGNGESSVSKPEKVSGKSFDSVIDEALNKVTQIQEDVDKAVSELSSGGDITTAVLAIEKADMSFQLMVEVRNKLISTYQEVMRMQV